MTEQDFFFVVKNIFNNFEGILTLELTPEEIDDWDSMGHLSLIMAFESKYNIKIEFEEAIMIDNLNSLFKLIKSKI